MTKHGLLVAAMMIVLAATASGQLTSSPLEPGLYDCLRARTRNVVLVSDKAMQFARTNVDWKSPVQITLRSVIAHYECQSDETQRRIAAKVDEYNSSAGVGTLSFDEASGDVVMVHHLNPTLSNVDRMADVVEMFNDAANQQAAIFSPELASCWSVDVKITRSR